MAAKRETPSRSRLRTVGRRKSCRMRPGQPAALQAVAMEHAGDDPAVLLQAIVLDEVLVQRSLEFRRERERSAVTILGRTRIKAHDAAFPIHLSPLVCDASVTMASFRRRCSSAVGVTAYGSCPDSTSRRHPRGTCRLPHANRHRATRRVRRSGARSTLETPADALVLSQ